MKKAIYFTITYQRSRKARTRSIRLISERL